MSSGWIKQEAAVYSFELGYRGLNNVITLASSDSAVIAVALGAIPVLGFVHGSITTGLRKDAKVPYPHSYATVEQCKSNVSILLSAISVAVSPTRRFPN